MAVYLISFSFSAESMRLALFCCFKNSANLFTIALSVVSETFIDVCSGLDVFLSVGPIEVDVGAPEVCV